MPYQNILQWAQDVNAQRAENSMISADEYNTFVIEYYANKWPNQRFGQAFVNKFIDGPDTELFYEEDIHRAKEIAWNKYVST